MKFAAVIVLYNPNIEEVLENVHSYMDAYDEVICIDNSSDDNSKYFQNDNIRYVPLLKNTGIACALNKGVSLAIEYNADIITTFDQDTYLSEESAKNLIDSVVENTISAPLIKRIYRDKSYKRIFTDEFVAQPKTPLWVITSGSTFTIQTYDLIGGFDNKLFIGQVDYDFCYKLYLKGGKISIIDKSVIFQELGSTCERKLAFWTVHIANLAPMRYYYIFRNEMYLRKKYGYGYRPFYVQLYKYIAGIIFFEQNKVEKIKLCIKGYFAASKMSIK